MSTSPTPPKRGGRILLATAIGVVLLVVAGCATTTDTEPDPTPPPTELPKEDPMPEPEPEPAPERVEVPELSGLTQAGAEQILVEVGLKATTKSRSTDQYPAKTVISQSPKAGAEVLPDTTIRLVVAKTPPPPEPPPPPPPPPPEPSCDPSYPDVCLDPAVEDYDCAGGSGNGPEYVEGPIRVRAPDPFDLDREGDGWGCENG
jgi:hypothetical protein